ncbi:NADH-quinone oxidoreductase subunit B [Sulfurovum sp.]|uniref:NADH-quinone oxidoreductase subunit B n=1 Tax=Sulfurovum sp. TaxID=1969726 RepID=UPI00356967FC
MGLEEELSLGDSVLVTKLDTAVNWARSYSMWPMVFGTACCGIEFMSVAASKHDISRFGAEVVRFSPRQADLLVVAGTISYKQAPILKKIYDQMPEPKWVISMGACACSGGFYDNYTTVQGIDEIIPVDEYIAGCPPRPEAFFESLMRIQEKSKDERLSQKNRQHNSGFKGFLDA